MKFAIKIPLRAFAVTALMVGFFGLSARSAERLVVGELFTNFS